MKAFVDRARNHHAVVRRPVASPLLSAGPNWYLQRTRLRQAIGAIAHSAVPAPVLQRIAKTPSGVPFDGEIIPWSAALRSSPGKPKDAPLGNVVADLPRGQPVRVLGGRGWIFVKAHVGGLDRTGYVSHELICKTGGTATGEFVTDAGDPISTGGGASMPPLSYEVAWMKTHDLTTKVKRVPNSATSAYNCHGFVYLNASAWLNDPAPVIRDNGYSVPVKPQVGDAVVYTKAAPALDSERKPSFSEVPPHSGLVTQGGPGNPTEVTSKWGSWHIYRHKPTDVWSEYGQPTYLRSARAGGHIAKREPATP